MSGMDRLTDEKLGRFNHHPNPAIDFCIEVEMLESRLHQAQLGLAKPGDKPEAVEDVYKDICRAMDFTVGGDQGAVSAKGILRELLAHRRASQTVPAHEDDLAVDRFAAVMKSKLAKKRNDGRGGWSGPECSEETLSRMLRDHIAKGDPVDVANFAMMLHQRGERIAQVAPTPSDGLREAAQAALDAWVQDGLDVGQAMHKLDVALSASPAQEGAEDKAFNEALEKAIGIARRCGAFATARDIRKLIRTVEE